jgi:hypothetical protein
MAKILILGASYGSLLASKLLFGGHEVKLVCLPAEADLINSEGFRVRMPVRGRAEQVEIDSRKLPGKVSAGGTGDVSPSDYDPWSAWPCRSRSTAPPACASCWRKWGARACPACPS